MPFSLGHTPRHEGLLALIEREPEIAHIIDSRRQLSFQERIVGNHRYAALPNGKAIQVCPLPSV